MVGGVEGGGVPGAIGTGVVGQYTWPAGERMDRFEHGVAGVPGWVTVIGAGVEKDGGTGGKAPGCGQDGSCFQSSAQWMFWRLSPAVSRWPAAVSKATEDTVLCEQAVTACDLEVTGAPLTEMLSQASNSLPTTAAQMGPGTAERVAVQPGNGLAGEAATAASVSVPHGCLPKKPCGTGHCEVYPDGAQ